MVVVPHHKNAYSAHWFVPFVSMDLDIHTTTTTTTTTSIVRIHYWERLMRIYVSNLLEFHTTTTTAAAAAATATTTTTTTTAPIGLSHTFPWIWNFILQVRLAASGTFLSNCSD